MTRKGEYKVQLELIGKNLDQLNRTQKDMSELRKETSGFQQMLKVGLGIDFAGRFTQGIGDITHSFTGAIRRGLDFNRTMFDAEVGISNVLKKFLELDDAAAKQEAAKSMQAIIALEPQTAAGLSDLVQGFLATVASAQAVGVQVDQNIDLVGKFANALANANIDASQLSQELRAIFTGNITPDALLAQTVGITNTNFRAAKEAGAAYEFLNEKLGSLGESGYSASTRLSTLNSAIDKLLGEITAPVFDTWLTGIGDMTKSVNNPELLESLQGIGLMLGDLTALGFDLTQWAVENADALIFLAQAAAALGSAFLAIKARKLLGSIGDSTRAWWAGRLAIEAQTTAVARNTAELSRNALVRKAGLGSLILGPIGFGVLAAALPIIKAIETSTLARLEAEKEITREIGARLHDNAEALGAVQSLEEAERLRLETLEKIAEIGSEIAALEVDQEIYAANRSRTGIGGPRDPAIDKQIANLAFERETLRNQLEVSINDPEWTEQRIADNQAKAEGARLTAEQNKAYAESVKRLETLNAKVLALREAYALGALDDSGKLAFLEGKVAEVNAALAQEIATAKTFPDVEKRAAVIADAEAQADEKRIPLLEAIRDLEAAIGKEKADALESAEAELEAERQKVLAVRDGVAALQLSAAQAERDAIAQNPFLTTAQQNVQAAPLLERENQLIVENIALLKERLESGDLDGEGIIDANERLLDLYRDQNDLQREMALNSFGGEFRAELTTWLDSFGSNAQQVAGILTNTVGAAINGISQQTTRALLITGDWGAAWDNMKLAVAQTFVEMVVRYAATRAAMFIISKTFGLSEAALGFSTAAALTAAWTPAAIAASIATLGGASGAGTAAYLTSLAVGKGATQAASLIPGFADGGIYQGAGGPRDDANLIRISDGEGIVQERAIRHYGEDFFNAFNNLELGSAPIGARGVATGTPLQGVGNGGAAGGSSAPNITIIPVNSEREATRIARHSEARGDIVRIVREDRDQIFGDDL